MDISHLLIRDRAYIGGQWTGADDGRVTEVFNPACGQLVGTVPLMARAETLRAIDSAAAAMPAWRARTATDRSSILRRWFDLIERHREDLAVLLTCEQGKPVAEARAEIAQAAAFIEWFAEEARRVYGDTILSPIADQRIVTLKQPVGVVAAITPWNFPSAMVTRKVGPALAAGCTVVLKPAPQTPLSALALAALAERAGIPPGVFNVVTGDAAAIGEALTQSAIVRKLSFTGSTRIGKMLMAQCASTMKRVSLELGGNAPFIVLADADLRSAVNGAIDAKFRNNGQTCVCANRLLIHNSVYESFTTMLVTQVETLAIGRGLDGNSQQGPLIDSQVVEKLEDLIADAVAKGATVRSGGARHRLGRGFFPPTVLTDVTMDMRVAQEEIFGPIAPLIRFEQEADAVAIANDTPFGLASYIYTRDLARAWSIGERLETGMLGINTGRISTVVAPFGGIKESGVGREGSKYGLEEYLDIKYVCLGGIPAAVSELD